LTDSGSGADIGAPVDDGGRSDMVAPPDVSAGQTCLAPKAGDPPAMLSATGCVDSRDPKKPAVSLIPYDVNSPLWSDGASKQRYMALPDGKKIHIRNCAAEPAACDVLQGGISENGHLDFPVGTVLVKSFLIGDTPIETRLLIHVSQDFWKGFSYRWNDAATEALMLPDLTMSTERMLPGQTWQFPSRAQCLQCHTEPAGRSLGPTVAQLNRDFDYPSGTANQLATLEKMGLLDAPLAMPPAMLPAYPSPASTSAMPEQRTRSYLHANCAICHRPGGTFAGMDMRFEAAFKDQELCNVAPMRGNLGVPGSVRLAPGDPAKSIVSLRMHTLTQAGMVRMPQIGSVVVDPMGTMLVDDWIRSIKTCP
jgi:uncharacterized repeat protein (TIGR03806 family)